MQLYYTVLSTIVLCSVVVWTAPLAENEIELAKRAKETIMYGNQQNSPRRVKKNDPSLNKDVSNDADLKGQVLAMPARDVPANEEKEKPLPPTEGVKNIDNSTPLKPETNNNESDVMQSSTPDDIDPDVQDMLQGDSVVSSDEDADDDSVEDPLDVPALPSQNEDQLANWYHYLLQYGDLLDNSPYSRQSRNKYYAYRRRRSLLKYFKEHKDDSNKAVKRGKRIKRDLYDDDLYYYPFQTPGNLEPSYGDVEPSYGAVEPSYGGVEPSYGGVEPEVDESDLLAYLLSLYDREEEEPAYGYEAPYERVLEEPEEEEPMFYPVKRQMLSTIPGLRKRYFYPVNNEPQTHWGAFVPQQKREYLDAYDRVLRLARALESRDEPDYYPELYEGYKKK